MKNYSIVIATFNGEKYIREQLESLVFQKIQPTEIVVSDDNSTDDTIKIIKEFKKKYSNIDWKIIVNSKNKGFRENFYQSIAQATQKYIFLCDQDDIWNLDKTEIMLNYFSEIPEILVLVSDFNFFVCENGVEDWKARKKIKGKVLKNSSNLYKVNFFFSNFLNKRPGWTFCIKKEMVPLLLELKKDKKELFHDEVIWYIGLFSGKLFYLKKITGQWRRFGSSVTSIDKKENRIAKFSRLINNKLERTKDMYMLLEQINKLEKISIDKKIRFHFYIYMRYFFIFFGFYSMKIINLMRK